MGLVKRIQMSRQLQERKLEVELAEVEFRSKQLQYTRDSINSLENYKATLDDDKGWLMAGVSAPREELKSEDVTSLQNSSYTAYRQNPHGRAVLRGHQKYIIGRGVTVDHRSNRPDVKAYWDRFVKANKWGNRQKEVILRGLRDGEVMLYKKPVPTKGESTILLRFIEPFEIGPRDDGTPTFGIGTNPKDVEEVEWYNRRTKNTNGTVKDERIEAKDLHHIKLNCDSTDKRGIPILEPVLKYITKYEQWLADRIILNKIRTAVALIKQYEATPEQLATIRGTNRSTSTLNVMDNKQRMLEPGTVIHATEGVTYKFLSPDLDAKDVATDGRAILLAIAAGVGQPEYLVTGDSSNSNYSSSLVAESPGVREVEDYQDFFANEFAILYEELMRYGIERGDIDVKEESEEFEKAIRATFVFPPIISRDYLRENQAHEVQRRNGALSIKTWQEKVGLDPENENSNMELEGDKYDKFIKGPKASDGDGRGDQPGQGGNPNNTPEPGATGHKGLGDVPKAQ